MIYVSFFLICYTTYILNGTFRIAPIFRKNQYYFTYMLIFLYKFGIIIEHIFEKNLILRLSLNYILLYKYNI